MPNDVLIIPAQSLIELSGSVTSSISIVSDSLQITGSHLNIVNDTTITGSLNITNDITASNIAVTQISSSNLNIYAADIVANDITASGVVTALEFHTQFISASIIYQSGSTKFGDTADDVHERTGSVQVSGSLFVTGSTQIIRDDAPGILNLIRNDTTSITEGDNLGALDFKGTDPTISSQLSGRINVAASQTWGASAAGANMLFRLVPDGSTSLSTMMFISSSGNVGIGTSTPTAKLEIYDTSTVRAQVNYNGTNISYWEANSNGTTYIGTQTASTLGLVTNNSTRVLIDSSGNVGIGITPNRELHVHATDTSCYMQFTHSTSGTGLSDGMLVGFDTSLSYVFTYANVPLTFGTNATEKMRIDTSGKVGIGDTSATYGLTLGAGLGALSLGNVESNTADLSTSATINANYLIRGFNGWWGLRQYSTGVGSDHTLSFDVYNTGSELSGLAIMQSGDVGVNFTSTNDLGAYTAPSLSVIGTASAISSIQVGATIADYEGAYGDFVVVHGNTTAPEKRLAIIRGEAGGATANNRGGRFRFYTKQDNSSAFNLAMTINEYAQTTVESTLGIPFWVGRPSGTDGRFIVLYDTVTRGYLGADSTYSFQVYDSTNTISTLAVTDSATSPGVVSNGSATGSPYFSFRQAGSEKAYVQYGNASNLTVATTVGHVRVSAPGTSNEILRVNHTSGTGSPLISFTQNDTRVSYIQHDDGSGSDKLYIVSEYGPIQIWNGTGGSETLKATFETSGVLTMEASYLDAQTFGIRENSVTFKRKVVSIGAWNMDTTATVSIAHGVTSGKTNIREVFVMIYIDDTPGGNVYPLNEGSGGAPNGWWSWTDTTVVCTRTTGGSFDSTNYDSTTAPSNRGYIVITYV